MSSDGQIPTDGTHRGVGLHEKQSGKRLAVVRADIDAAHALQELDELIAFADDPGKAPESRLLAKAKALATLDDAVERRAPRSRMTVWSRERVKASAIGCDSMHWRSPTHFGSLLDKRDPGRKGMVPRDAELISSIE